ATRELLSQTLLDMTATLRARLDAPKLVGDVRAHHLARISAKRLRYVLEPLAEGRFGPPAVARMADAAVADLALLQDELGRIHDAHLFRRWLRERRPGGLPRPANLNVRLRGLQRLLLAQATAAYESIGLPAGRRRMHRVLRAIQASASAMAQPPSTGDTFST